MYCACSVVVVVVVVEVVGVVECSDVLLNDLFVSYVSHDLTFSQKTKS